ncbi:MAG TPA: SusC/RagA family TonB-linked outer membrane protein [Ohtaekwangia sp.]
MNKTLLKRLFSLAGKRHYAILLLMLAWTVATNALAQTSVTGTILSGEDASPIPGVNILVKGSSAGTISDADGRYTIDVPSSEAVLIFSFVGYASQEVPLAGRTSVDVTLASDARQLSEIVVTALGIEKEKRDLGYSVQDIKGDAFTQARETNIVNGLAGKVAGVQVISNPSGVGSSARVTIRGERSLDINNNQPLFIVDGVPISNSFVGSSGRGSQDVDYGNGAAQINPDDVESMTVLKGPSATALYGARGQNGVIIIKSKSGKGKKGIGVAVNTTVTSETALRLPDYQNVYGQGLGGEFAFVDGSGSGTQDGVDENWGPKMDDHLTTQYDGATSNGYRGGDVGNLNTQIGPVDLASQLELRGDITPTPFHAYRDNVKDFFETGLTYAQNVSLSGSNDQGDFRASYTYLDQKGIVPNTDLLRNTFSIAAGYNLTDKLSVRVNSNYVASQSDNRPSLSYGTENIMYLFNCWFPRSANISTLRNYWQEGREGLNQFNFNYNYHDNPYFNVYENTNGMDGDRIYGNVAATYKFTDWLSLMVRGGTDYNTELRTHKRAWSTQRFPLGSYREEKITFQETNLDFLLSFNKELNPDFTLTAYAGGNLMKQYSTYSDVFAPQLTVPGTYSLNNSRVAIQASTYNYERKINSIYGSVGGSYRNYLFLDFTMRNDWSSSLPSANWSYFYPSASLSAVLTDIFKVASGPLSFAKLRVGVAGVGNSPGEFKLVNTFQSQTAAQGLPAYSADPQINNAMLVPEQSRSYEVGADVRFFNNRVGLDVSYYLTQTKNQAIPVPLSITSGYSSRMINAGMIENKGMEVILNLIPLELANGFRWNIDVNFSTNRSKVKELYTDPVSGQKINNYVMANRYVTVEARVGERMGDMYGIGYQRVSGKEGDPYYDPTGEFVGRIVYNSQGKPVPTATTVKLGNYNPDWMAGINNSFSFKGISASFLVDIRQGGEIYSHTQTVGREGGIIEETLEGRANGYDLSLPGNGVIGDGVVPVSDGDGNITGYVENATKLSAREWHTSITLGRRLIEGMVYDASYVKLREVKIGYTLPNQLLKGMAIRDVSISFVGRNLALWTDVPHVDPETASTAGGVIIPGVESVAIPSATSYGFNLNFKL